MAETDEIGTPKRSVQSASEIPDAAYYVCMTDSFMSGWGPAEGKEAVYVAPADSYEEAEIVAENARARGDQKRIRINATKPKPRSGWLLLLMNKADSARWYEKGAFDGS